MPTLYGHAVAGTPFAVVGLWFIIQAFRRYYRARESRVKYRAVCSYYVDLCGGRLRDFPVDAVMKIVAFLGGFITELGFSEYPENSSYDVHVAQHCIIYLSFGLSGVVDLLIRFRVPVPADSDYLSLFMSMMLQAVIFHGHLAGRTPLDVLVHSYVIYAPLLGAVCVLLEMTVCRRHVLASVARGYLVLLQGSWFFAVGFILYNPIPGAEKWDEHDPEQMMTATVIFCVHVMACFVVTLVIGTVIGVRFRRKAAMSSGEKRKGEVGFEPLLPVYDNGFEVDVE